MEKEKAFRKRASDPRDNLPTPPPNPQHSKLFVPEAFRRILDYKDREATFLKNLNETISADCKKLKSEGEKIITSMKGCEVNENTQQMSEKSNADLLSEECENFIGPLLNRTGPSISAALVAHDAFEQLNRLHGLLDQMLTIQEQNYQMRRYLRDVRTICELKKLQKKDSHELLNEEEESDYDLDLENQTSLLSAILAAGNSASSKRSSAKRQRERSKSVIADDIQMFAEKENKSQLRRQSAFSESKAKVSKWTKVKAAFKWEKANVPALNEGKSSDSGIGLTPNNNEIARYLRVPSVPCTGSSADSILSLSSGHLLSGGSIPPTPGTISSASSIEDMGAGSEEMRNHRDSSKSDSRCDSRLNEEESRRSHSLDGESVILPTSQNKNKTPWKKVKDIIQTHRGSFKGKPSSRSVKSAGSITGSRDVSPCESIDTISNLEDRNECFSSHQASPTQKNVSLNIQDQESGSLPSSPNGPGSASGRDECDLKSSKSSLRASRRSRVLSDFESLPEGATIDLKTNYSLHKPPPSPLSLNTRQDSSDTEFVDCSYSPVVFLKSPNKSFKPKKQHIPGNGSVPSSPSRRSEFFGEIESEDLSSGDFSEPTTPHRKLSPKTSLQVQQEEVNEKYLELREKLNREFETKRLEWAKIRAACSVTTSCAHQFLGKDENLATHKNAPTKLLEENLSADFKKKLHKWRVKKQNSISNIKDSQTSPTKETDSKKIDWNLWKTGQLKLEGQGLTPLPDQKDLPEDFQKKLEQWKKMKESNTVPPYNSQDSLKRRLGSGSKLDGFKKTKDDDKSERDKRPERDKTKLYEKDKLERLSKLRAIVTDLPAKEIEVQTSVGIMKFEGISRKFTRKLYEWEKARGIGPESSTFALLHPGYRPLDVGNVPEERKSHENSPTLGRSLSLDSISPNPSVPSISHQPSSLSLNDMDELKEASNGKRMSSSIELEEKEQIDEPEAVIVEVEDDIVETAAPLVTAIPIVEQQTPVYKYEVPCNEFCAGKKEEMLQTQIKSNKLSPQTVETVNNLTIYLNDYQDDYTKNIDRVQSVLESLKDSLPELERCVKEESKEGRESLKIVKNYVSDLMEMLNSLREDKTSCKEILHYKSFAIENKLRDLERNINLICKNIDVNKSIEQIPKINITSDDNAGKGIAIVSITPTIFQSQVVVNQPKVLIANPAGQSIVNLPENTNLDTDADATSKKISRNLSNNSKKKIKLRKMGSRQNSKTESDSSDDETMNVLLEAPRRLKRKASRTKKPYEEEKNVEDKKEDPNKGEDIVYILKIMPGQKMEQREGTSDSTNSNILISPTESCIQLIDVPSEPVSSSANVFVKTQRKIFSTMEKMTGETKTVILKDLVSSASDKNEKDESELEKLNVIQKSLPPLPQSPIIQKKSQNKATPPKEPSPSIKLMIAKYNQKLASEKIVTRSTSCSPVAIRSPLPEHRVKHQTAKYQNQTKQIKKSVSAENLPQNETLTPVQISARGSDLKAKTLKSSSIETISTICKNISNQTTDFSDDDYKPSLACDSLKLLNKQSKSILKLPLSEEIPKKEHLYRKNKEKPTTLFTKTNSGRKIGVKSAKSEFMWRRSISSSGGEMSQFLADKSNNTIPTIIRKLDSNKMKSAIDNASNASLFPSLSAPTTPSDEVGRPKTPLSERAMKLQKAKEDFLRGHVVHTSYFKGAGNDDSWKKRFSQSSIASESSNEDCHLSKSASVGIIDSNNADNEHIGGYVSLPRVISRSAKITSKLGFSTIASKFRKVKMRRGSKEQPKLNTVSALCRQSLGIDIAPAESNSSSAQKHSTLDLKNLSKSGSTQALGLNTLFKKHEKLSKSKSVNTVQED